MTEMITTPVEATVLTATPPASYGELVAFWNENQTKVIELKSNLDSMVSSLNWQNTRVDRLTRQIAEFENYLKDHVRDEEIDPDIAGVYADIFAITLDREISVTFSIQMVGTARIPFGKNADEIDWESEVTVNMSADSDYDLDVYVDSMQCDWEDA